MKNFDTKATEILNIIGIDITDINIEAMREIFDYDLELLKANEAYLHDANYRFWLIEEMEIAIEAIEITNEVYKDDNY